MIGWFKKFAVVMLASLLWVGAAQAALVKTLFLGYDYNVGTTLTDIIGSDARFDPSNSAASPASGGNTSFVPTLAYLQQFDSILYFTNYFPGNASAVGDVLADYVDGGGHVVLATFVGQEVPNAGRIMSTGYNPFTQGVTNAYTSSCLGSYDSGHAIMAGVSNICASTYRGDYAPGLDAGATLVASWSDGKPFVGINANQDVITISLFPNVAQYQHASGEYRTLFANALAFDAEPAQVPEPAGLVLVGLALLALTALRRRAG